MIYKGTVGTAAVLERQTPDAIDRIHRAIREGAERFMRDGAYEVARRSTRKGGNRLRITAQLIDAATNNHIWADRFDGELTDIFALQDEITKKVVAAIEPKLLEAEGVRSQIRSSEDLGAWDLVMKANSHLWRQTKVDSEAAIAMLRKAAERYPDYAPGARHVGVRIVVSIGTGRNFKKP